MTYPLVLCITLRRRTRDLRSREVSGGASKDKEIKQDIGIIDGKLQRKYCLKSFRTPAETVIGGTVPTATTQELNALLTVSVICEEGRQ